MRIPSTPEVVSLCRATVILVVALGVLVASSGPVPAVASVDKAPPAQKAGETGPAKAQEPDDLSLVPPAQREVAIQAPVLPGTPAPGKGRLKISLQGNRRWCTYPDDRVVRPPEQRNPKVPTTTTRNQVYTFGYQFSIAAVERSRPGEVLMLLESPVFRTAVYRQAAKLGRGGHKAPAGPQIVDPGDIRAMTPGTEQPSTVVPYWQEQFRCTSVPETIDLDLDPGVYDVYMAFDILLRSGAWAHRTIAFQTDVPIEAGRGTRLPGTLSMAGAARREFELFEASPLPAGAAGAGGR